MSKWQEWFPKGFWKEIFSTEKIWGLGIKINEPVKTVIRREDYPRVRETLRKAAEYADKHPGE